MESKAKRVEVDGFTLVWGDAATWRAVFRQEQLERRLNEPVEKRLAAALALVLPGTRGRGEPK